MTSTPSDIQQRLISSISNIRWPAIPSPSGAILLSTFQFLDQSQWLSGDAIEQHQFMQLDVLARHAWTTTPHYRSRWQGIYEPCAPLTRSLFAELPVLKRHELQQGFDALVSRAIPKDHGEPSEHRSSGSTGMPVRVLKTGVNHVFWNAITLRDHVWHCRDLSGTLVAIRHGVGEGRYGNWGTATDGLLQTGTSHVIGVKQSIEHQWNRLQALQPTYLMAYPSIAAELAKYALEERGRLPLLREVRTFGELLSDETRSLCEQAFGVPVTDIYSAEEAGYLALQCPTHRLYHVQSENVYLEVLDEYDHPCPPGVMGRVVVTDLHNFATPLIRYELGDYAERADPCLCTRGLPALRRIAGRTRNTLVTASGERFWPAFGSRAFAEIDAITQHQMVQLGLDHVEARLVAQRPLTGEENRRFRSLVLARLPAGFRLTIAYVERIERSSRGKYEDFISYAG